MSYLDRDPHGMYRSQSSDGPGPRLMGADTLMGEDVVNRQDEDLGDIKEIMLDMQTGQIAYAVLSFGGIMGMGDKLGGLKNQLQQRFNGLNQVAIVSASCARYKRPRASSSQGFAEGAC